MKKLIVLFVLFFVSNVAMASPTAVTTAVFVSSHAGKNLDGEEFKSAVQMAVAKEIIAVHGYDACLKNESVSNVCMNVRIGNFFGILSVVIFVLLLVFCAYAKKRSCRAFYR